MKKSKKLRIVFDTNVFVSALVFGGMPRKVINMAIEDATVIVSPEILTELRHILHAKFPAFLEDLRRLEKLLKRDGAQVELGSVRVDICRDPDDNRVIETALIGSCDYIVSGDQDLLVIGSHHGLRIIKPAELLQYIDS